MKRNKEGLYEHTCPVCGEVFWGRRNKIYDKEECKTIANNSKAYALRQIAKDFDNQLHANHKILNQFLPYSKGKIQIDILPILRLGFDPHVNTGLVNHDATGLDGHVVYNLAFVLTNNNKEIIIFVYEK